METRSGKRRPKSVSRPPKTKSKKKRDDIPNSLESNETEDSDEVISVNEKAEQICKEIRNIDEKYSKIDMSEWNLDEIAEQLGKPDTECTVQLTSADDVEESENHFACDEIYANGAKDIKRRMGKKQVNEIGKSARSVTAVPQLNYNHLRWLIRVKIAKDLQKIVLGKLHSFYHINFTSRGREMPSALIRTTMFSEDQFKYICGSLKGLFVKNKPISELNYTLHVLLPETLIRIVMFVKKVEYKHAQSLMDKHLFDKPMPSKEALQ